MKLGLENLLESKLELLHGKKVGLLAHSASVTRDHLFGPYLLYDHPDINLVKFFAPEHGLFGVAQDMEFVSEEIDQHTKLPVRSLYGSSFESLTPTPADLEDIDVLIVDLQDIGTRYYTYIYTMALCMKACGEAGKEVIVLDRPNPLGGNIVEGNILDRKFTSFVGLYPLPVRHGMTIAELATYFNSTENFNCDLTVIPMQGWTRDMMQKHTGLSFYAPSPNMPTPRTAFVYPGQCLFEATELSEGRGTTKPFEWIGTPGLDAFALANKMNERHLDGVHFRPIHFKPGFQKHAGEVCSGVELLVTNKATYRPYLTSLLLLKTIYKYFPASFNWREKPYEFVKDIPAIDLLTGCDTYRTLLEKGKSIRPWLASFADDEARFMDLRKPYLLYE